MREKPSCEVCQKLKGARWDAQDCAQCVPPLHPENEDAEQIFFTVQDQYIMGGMGGPVAINQMAIHAAMDLYEVEFKQDCFEKVLAACRELIDESKEKQQSKKGA